METIITEEMKEEILMLCGALTYNDGLTAYEITKIIDNNTIDECPYCQLLGVLYKYGKIQGIREERAKRKKALANKKLTKASI